MNRRSALWRDVALVLLGALLPAVAVVSFSGGAGAAAGSCTDPSGDPDSANTAILDVVQMSHADATDTVTLTLRMSEPFDAADVGAIEWFLDFDSDAATVEATVYVEPDENGELQELDQNGTVSHTDGTDTISVTVARSVVADAGAAYTYDGYTSAGPADDPADDVFGPCTHTLTASSTTTTTAQASTTSTTAGSTTSTTASGGTTTSTTTSGGATSTTTSGGANTTANASAQIDVSESEAEVSDTTPAAGDEITIEDNGGHFEPDAELDIELFGDAVLLGTTTADDDGNYRATVRIPADTEPGDHEIVVSGPGADAETHLSSRSITVGRAAGSRGTGGAAPACSTFRYQEDAEAYLDDHPEAADELDADGDGKACEALPSRGRTRGGASGDERGDERGGVAVTGADVERLVQATAFALLLGNLFLVAAVAPRRRPRRL